MNTMQIVHKADRFRSRTDPPTDPTRYCVVNVLVPGKRMVERVELRWSGGDWLFNDGLRLSRANVVLSWRYR
ncbi:MAG: hypothetical protein H6595_11630 [Flavobacteriales bacterium]|nr:hypothetical protein [Flavobacteriales bacterium]MCB9168110.1 hypothetical protein [Flavobacteriales bacterium]